MKTIKYSIILLAIVMFFTSCYKDDSNETINVINPIVIDNSVQETTITIYQMDTLHISPSIYKNGVEDANLKYEWKISGEGIVPQVLGNSMTLHEVISIPPKSTSYTMTLTVTDELTSIQNFATYYITVQAQFGNGLIVADTRDGGLTSDISLVRAQNFSGGNYSARQNRIFRDVYSSVNQTRFEGKIKGMMSSDYYGESRFITIYSDNSVVRVDPYDFAVKDRDNDLFYVDVPEADFKLNDIAYVNTYAPAEYFNVNGKLYPHKLKFSSYFGYMIFTKDKSDYRITKMSQSGISYEFPFLFDDLNKRFLQGDMDYASITVFDNIYQNSAFDINNIGAYTPIFMGRGQSGIKKALHSIMKSDADGRLYCYSMEINDLLAYPPTIPNPLYKYDLNSCERVNEAIAFECNPQEDVLYYATKDGIYSSLLGQNNVLSSKKVYTPVAGEEITAMALWRAYGSKQGMVKIKDENQTEGYSTISALNRMMIISTYNEATQEGKIITIPIPNLGSGELEKDRDFHTIYDGFGEIIRFDQQCV